jgi:hypothetical protein
VALRLEWLGCLSNQLAGEFIGNQQSWLEGTTTARPPMFLSMKQVHLTMAWEPGAFFFYLGCLEMGYWTYASFSQSHFASFLWAFWHDTSFGYGTEHMVYQSAISTLKGQYGKTLEFRGVPILYTNNTNTYLVIFVGVIRLINQEFLQNIPIDFHPYSHPPATMLCSCRKFAQWWYQWSGPSSTWG